MQSFQSQVKSVLQLDEADPLSKEELHTSYKAAHQLYDRGSYRKASFIFSRLALTNPFCFSYWQGLAASKQMSKDYEAALRAWALLCLLDAKNPQPHLHAAECFILLEEKQEALKALKSAKELATDSSLENCFQNLKERIDELC